MIHLQIPQFTSTDPLVTLTSVDWVLASDIDFTTIIDQSLNDTVNLTDYKSPLSVTSGSIYFRARYNIDNNGVAETTDWSNIAEVGSSVTNSLEDNIIQSRLNTELIINDTKNIIDNIAIKNKALSNKKEIDLINTKLPALDTTFSISVLQQSIINVNNILDIVKTDIENNTNDINIINQKHNTGPTIVDGHKIFYRTSTYDVSIKKGTVLSYLGKRIVADTNRDIPYSSKNTGVDVYIFIKKTAFNFNTFSSANAITGAFFTKEGINTDPDGILLGGFHYGLDPTVTESATPSKTTSLIDSLKGVNPYSIWDLNFRPVSDTGSMVYIEKANKWFDIYLLDNKGNPPVYALSDTTPSGTFHAVPIVPGELDGNGNLPYSTFGYDEIVELANLRKKSLITYEDWNLILSGVDTTQTNIAVSPKDHSILDMNNWGMEQVTSQLKIPLKGLFPVYDPVSSSIIDYYQATDTYHGVGYTKTVSLVKKSVTEPYLGIRFCAEHYQI